MVGDRALLVFARNPVAGRVKTRLSKALGAAGAAAVYRRLLTHTLDVAARVKTDSLSLWIDDGPPNDDLEGILSNHRVTRHQQHGDDLGARMNHALDTMLNGYRSAVLIGSDCAEFDTAYLDAAFDALHSVDVVIGPAADGGYLLIGCMRRHPDLFRAMPWGGGAVADITRQRLDRLGLSRHELPVLRDVDVPADLVHCAHLVEHDTQSP